MKPERQACAYLLFFVGTLLVWPSEAFGRLLPKLPPGAADSPVTGSSAPESSSSSSSWNPDAPPKDGEPTSTDEESPTTTSRGSRSPGGRGVPGSAAGGTITAGVTCHAGGDIEGDNFDLELHYRYNGGGGYTCISSPHTDFTLNIQNQFTVDGTFADRNVPTTYQGFTIPFYRTYLFGDITKNIDYQAAVQGSLGSFNLLDLWVNARYDDRLNLRVGRMLTPFLYEYYAFSPAWEPVINNSLLFQTAGKRQEGAMLWGKLFDNKLQYHGGVFNGVSGSFFGIGRNVSFLGDFTVTPFKGQSQLLDSLGFGMGVQTGWQDYLLSAGNNLNFINGVGEPTLNNQFVTTTGVPFFQYASNIAANGNQAKFAPHFFWYGRFSLLGEYVWMDRTLTNGTITGVSVTQGWYMNASYFLTGERYSGDGLGGYTTITPRSPFIPTKKK